MRIACEDSNCKSSARGNIAGARFSSPHFPHVAGKLFSYLNGPQRRQKPLIEATLRCYSRLRAENFKGKFLRKGKWWKFFWRKFCESRGWEKNERSDSARQWNFRYKERHISHEPFPTHRQLPTREFSPWKFVRNVEREFSSRRSIEVPLRPLKRSNESLRDGNLHFTKPRGQNPFQLQIKSQGKWFGTTMLGLKSGKKL